MTETMHVVGSTQQFDLPLGLGPDHSLPDPQIVGSDSALSDADDTTYWDLGYTRNASFNGSSTGFAQIETGPLLAGSSLRWHLRLACALTDSIANTGFTLTIVSKEGAGPAEADFGGRFYFEEDVRIVIPGSLSGFGDYSSDFIAPDFGWFYPNYPVLTPALTPTWDDVADLLAAGDAWVKIQPIGNSAGGGTHGLFQVRASEFSITGDPAVADPTAPRPPAIGGGPGVGSAPAPGSGSGDPTAPVAGDTAPTEPALGGGFLTPGRRRGAPTDVEVLVDGHWLSLNCQIGDPTWSHTWPGGSANASWTATDTPTRLTRRGLPVQLAYGGQRFWAGVLDLPGGDGTMNAVGLATLGGDYTALDADGDATTVPDDAIDAAITRGLPWLRRDSFSADAQDVDISSGPVTLGALLDAAATDARKRWAVDPDGYVYAAPDPTVPTGHVLYLDAPLTPADDQLATALVGRYFNGTDYATTTVVADSAAWLGYLEATVDLTGRGTLTEEKAIDKLQALLDLGRALPAWADPIALVYGDLVTAGQVPVELATFTAGQVVRVGGQFDATQQLGGRTWVDVLVGQSDGGGGSLSLTPIGAPVFGLFDAITQLQNRKGA